MATKVVIGIQARSGSTRLPGKVFEKLGRKSILRHVIDACRGSSLYINNNSTKQTWVDIALCIPKGDPIGAHERDLPVVEGPEEDVLARYQILSDRFRPDYIVRITADCPLIPHFVITKCITAAVKNQYDYFSNVDERVRTAPDGFDCEVISQRALLYAFEHATDPKDREHVTPFLRHSPPEWLTQGMIINFLDLSQLKISVDTLEDLEKVRQEFNKIDVAALKAEKIFGKSNVHRF